MAHKISPDARVCQFPDDAYSNETLLPTKNKLKQDTILTSVWAVSET